MTVFTVCSLPSLSYLDTRIFLNLTASMPKAFYLKKSKTKLTIGEIIVFKLNSKNGNFIKYVGGIEGDEFCIDASGALWVNGFPAAQKNIDKYPDQTFNVSECQILKKGTLIVIGEHPDSYDSRYFGPIESSQVIAQVRILAGIE